MKEQGANAGEGNFKTSKGADAYVGNLKKQHGFVDEECARGSYDVGMRTGNPGDVTRCTKQKTAKEKARGGGMRPPGASN